MKYAFAAVALASLAAAENNNRSAATATSSSCAAQNILNACVDAIQPLINSCSNTDYYCLCTNYANLLTCYINCPDDVGVGLVQQQREQNCNAASLYGSTITLTASSTQGSSTASATSGETTSRSEAIHTSSLSPTPTQDSSSFSTGAKAGIGVGIGLGTLLLIGALAAFIVLKRRRARRDGVLLPGYSDKKDPNRQGISELPQNEYVRRELDAEETQSESIQEI